LNKNSLIFFGWIFLPETWQAAARQVCEPSMKVSDRSRFWMGSSGLPKTNIDKLPP